jgi:hypothetical protein
MAHLPILENAAGETFHYPYVIERGGHLLIAFSRRK